MAVMFLFFDEETSSNGVPPSPPSIWEGSTGATSERRWAYMFDMFDDNSIKVILIINVFSKHKEGKNDKKGNKERKKKRNKESRITERKEI